MRELAQKRLRQNLKQSLKYLTLVFNDFFILAIIFLFGALMFWYAQSMKTMPAHLWFYRPLVGIILWLPLLTGRLATLFQEADQQFLFTQDEQVPQYLTAMYRYSLLLPWLLEILLLGIVAPFVTIKSGMIPGDYLLYALGLLIIKGTELLLEAKNLYFGKRCSVWLLDLFALLLAILGSYWPIVMLVIAIAGECLAFSLYKKQQRQLFDWRYAIAQEQARKDRVYSLYSMFTDVKERQVAIRRRKYLDFLLPKSLAKENPNRFLYRRSLLRNPEYLNLLVRMTAFAVLVSWLVQDWRWAAGLAALVIFLTVYQLLPMATEYDANIMYRVYPIVRQGRGQDLVHVLNLGLLLQWLLISLCWLLVLPINLNLAYAIVGLLVFVLLVNRLYLPYKVKANDKKLRFR